MSRQNQLFDTDPEPWELDDQDDWLAARVVFSQAPHGPYDYSIPGQLESSVRPGIRVLVPLGRGNRKMEGYVVQVISPGHPQASTVNASRLKPIERVLDNQPLLDQSLLELAQWISDYYVCPLGNVIETLVPPAVRDRSGTRNVTFLMLADGVDRQLDSLKLPPKQRAILELLASGGSDWTARELAESVGCTVAPVKALQKKGLIVSRVRRVRTDSHEIPRERRTDNLRLNTDQRRALSAIESSIDRSEHRCFLMHGITGSGKTEVYIQAIQRVVESGRQAIVLVPEISLTPQTRQRFRARFDQVAVLHSHLTPAQRAWHWHEIAAGRVQVIIGARSAIFAPAPRLGLIVLDEEHDGSFKQDKAPRYHARDVALWRARRHNIPLVLGSATPALESWHRARTGEFHLLPLPRRVLDLPLPDVATIDLRVDFSKRKSRGAISQKLHQEIRKAVADGGQVILLLNRRGFATRIQCPECGHVEYCPDCSIPMTHHRDGQKAVCHYCDHQIPEPDRCSECGNAAIRFSGIGTQKLEQEVRARFPDIPCMRMDTDTMRRPGSHELALDKFRSGEVKILLGTQMIAKGLDFPNVTLVGVVNADTALHFPDFRAAERTFGLVTQVAGRSGRGPKGGRVLVQTFSPDHPAIVAATRHDYAGFAEVELPDRQAFGYPPFGRLTRLVVRSPSQQLVQQMADRLAEQLETSAAELGIAVTVIGPAPAPVEKLRGQYRFHILCRTDLDADIQSVVRHVSARVEDVKDVQWIVDIDPLDML